MIVSRVIFCSAALAASFLVVKLAFPLAALPLSTVDSAQTPQSAELFDDVELGEFGVVPVLDMVQYYIDSPPEPTANSGAKKVRFQGC